MTDPSRLLQTHLDDTSLRALEAAVADEPPDGAKGQIWESIALALPAAGVLLGVTTTTGSAAASAAVVGEVATSTAVGTVGPGAIGLGATSAVATGTIGAGAVGSAAAGVAVGTVGPGAIGLGATSAVATGTVGAGAVGSAAAGVAVGAVGPGAVGLGATSAVATGTVGAGAVGLGATSAAATGTIGAGAVGLGATSAVATGTIGAGAVGLGATVATTGFGFIAGKAVALGLGIGLAAHVATGVVRQEIGRKPAVTIPATAKSVPRAAAGKRANGNQGRSLERVVGGSRPPDRSAVVPPTPAMASTAAIVSRSGTPASPASALQDEATESPLTPEPSLANDRRIDEQISSEPSPRVDEDLSDELRQESSLLVRARQALASAQPAVAMAYVAQHRERFPAGKLLQEREALEVQCLSRLGQTARAKARAQAFLVRYPASPHREKLRLIAGN